MNFFAQLSFTQLGTDIDGEAAGDYNGYSVSMNSAGDRIAIGATYNDGNGADAGHVRIYEWDGTAWTQLGIDIDGEAANDKSGFSVSMNSIGDRVVIGAVNNDENGSYAGHVRIYEWDGTAWTQLGIDIDGEAADDKSGYSVSMNSAGDRIAIGARGNDGNGTYAGHVRIYEWNGAAWTQLGTDIDGEAAYDKSGHVSMNATGNRVAIGARFNSGSAVSAGHVRIYEWDGTAWTQLGTDIDGEGPHDQSGNSVSINSSGNRVAIGAFNNDGTWNNGSGVSTGHAGHVRIYEWDGTAWTQLGTDIDGEAASDDNGWSVSMNSAGDRVAIGAKGNDGNGAYAGHVRIYEWDGTAWIQEGTDIDGEAANDNSGYSVSMNAAGDRVVIGAYRNDGNGIDAGHVRIYSDTNVITQSTSCSATILNTSPNTVCWDPNFGGMEPDGGVTIQFTDTINIDTNYLSYVINPSPISFPFGSFWSYTSDSNTVLLYLYYLDGNNYDIIISYDDLSGYSCSDTVIVTIPDNATWNINGGFDGDVVCDSALNGSVGGIVFDGEPPYYAYMGPYSATSVGNPFGNQIDFYNIPPGNYNVTVADANNCSFTDYVEIIVSDPQINTSNDTICEGDSITLSLDPDDYSVYSVFWPDGSSLNNYTFSPIQSGFHFFNTEVLTPIFWNSNSCSDSIYIEVLNNSTFSEVLTLCDSIVWNGVTYDSSGVYSDTIQNSLGCDSILILDVTFVQPTYGNETLTACDSITWNGITYDSSGTFIDTIPNHLGCDSIVTIDVNLVGNYDMRFLVAPVSLIAPPFIFPFINATPNLVNYDFTWDFGDGTVIATNDTNITHEYQYNGVYTVKLIAEDMVNNCGVDTLEKVNLINCSGGPSLSIEEAFNNLVLYPNPARYVVNIDYGTEENFNNHYLEIINNLGQQVFLNTIDASNIQIPVSNLGSKGLYFINIRNENNDIIVTKHLIIN